MKNLYEARLVVHAFGLLLSSTIERIITTIINNHFQLRPVIYHLISIIILTVLFILTNIMLKSFIRSKFISKRVFGKRYIGGRWIEIVLTENNEISHFSKLDITYEEDNINIHGDCYDKNYQRKYYFDSICSVMDKFELTYLFIAKEGNKSIREDIGHLRFEASAIKSPDIYLGHFEDKGMEFKVEGFLIKNKSIIKKMDKDFIKALKDDILPNLNTSLIDKGRIKTESEIAVK